MDQSWWVYAVCLLGLGVLLGALTRARWNVRAIAFPKPSQLPSEQQRTRYSQSAVDVKPVCELPIGFERRLHAGVFPLSQVVGTLLEGMTHPSGLYVVTFSPETLKALRSGDLHLMHSAIGDRANAVSFNGRVTEQAHIAGKHYDLAKACFQVASLVTGQYFLSRIDTKLQMLSTQVGQVLEMLETAESAKLIAAYSYLKIVVEDYGLGRTAQGDIDQLRNHLQNCDDVAQRCLAALSIRQVSSTSSAPLGPKERLMAKVTQGTEWVGNKIADWNASLRAEEMKSKARDFSRDMVKGTVALQTAFFFQGLLGQEGDAITARRLAHMANGFRSEWLKYSVQHEMEKTKVLADYWWFEADAKKAQFLRELSLEVSPIEQNLETLQFMQEARQGCHVQDIPDRVFMAVDVQGKPTDIFLPSN